MVVYRDYHCALGMGIDSLLSEYFPGKLNIRLNSRLQGGPKKRINKKRALEITAIEEKIAFDNVEASL